MTDIPDDIRLAFQIQAEGAENIERVCTEAFDLARNKMSGDKEPTRAECQHVYRFLAATAAVWIDLKLSEYPNLGRFEGFPKAVQERTCLHVCRMESFACELGDALFMSTWGQMVDDVILAQECFYAAARTNQGSALMREYPSAYFFKRHRVGIVQQDRVTIYFGATIAALVVIENVKANLAIIEDAYARNFSV